MAWPITNCPNWFEGGHLRSKNGRMPYLCMFINYSHKIILYLYSKESAYLCMLLRKLFGEVDRNFAKNMQILQEYAGVNKAMQTLGQQSNTVNKQTIAGQYLYVFTLFDIMSYLNSKIEFSKVV